MEESQTKPTSTPTEFTAAPATASSSLVKDLSIPIAIVIAGICIGAGLYFGGGQQAPVAAAPTAVAEADTTNLVDEVTAEDHIKGFLDAPIKVVEFSDFDCPFCSRFHEVMDAVVVQADDVAWVYRHFPLEQLHPNAPFVAVASECVAELAGNDGFWKFTDAYFAARGAGDKTDHQTLVTQLANEAGVSTADLTTCLESGRNNSKVQADVNDAVETGGRGTPWSIIISPSGKTYPLNGALPQSSVEQLIEAARNDA